MSDESLKAEIARNALQICVERIDSRAPVALPSILESTKRQLEWLVAYFEGRNTDRAKLKTLVFGHYAAREMDESDAEFVNALFAAAYVADITASGLKIEPHMLKKSV
jgi:hypothetical protein